MLLMRLWLLVRLELLRPLLLLIGLVLLRIRLMLLLRLRLVAGLRRAGHGGVVGLRRLEPFLAVIVAEVGIVGTRIGLLMLLEVRILLRELRLGRGDQAEIVLRVLEVALGGDRVAGRLRVARELYVLVGNVMGGAPDLHVRSVGFIDAGERIVIAPIAPAHTLVVLMTISHGTCLSLLTSSRALGPAHVS
jgi:hypothetical protein